MPATEDAWAEPSDADLYTGIQVTDAEIIRAQVIVELFAGTTVDASNAGSVSPRNLRHLTLAVAYQAAWMTSQPGLFINLDMDSLNQDGASQQ